MMLINQSLAKEVKDGILTAKEEYLVCGLLSARRPEEVG